eukprot:TRINITY_DN1849_c0_g1_i1.p1 TRINITY_DN1849_c0_g1~~TRINITY_DN1849_c0_g1_i1.p1  ORF type:complete len:958 (+),score=201.90 TRINITY_DN1849_c0_g1_i1:46-2919(+)
MALDDFPREGYLQTDDIFGDEGAIANDPTLLYAWCADICQRLDVPGVPSCIFLGLQSAGKSNLLRAALSFIPAVATSSQRCTVCPVVYTVLKVAAGKVDPRDEHYSITLHDMGGNPMKIYKEPAKVALRDLSSELKKIMKRIKSTEAKMQMEAVHVKIVTDDPMAQNMNLVDLPGLQVSDTDSDDLMKLVQSYLASEKAMNSVFVVCVNASVPLQEQLNLIGKRFLNLHERPELRKRVMLVMTHGDTIPASIGPEPRQLERYSDHNDPGRRNLCTTAANKYIELIRQYKKRFSQFVPNYLLAVPFDKKGEVKQRKYGSMAEQQDRYRDIQHFLRNNIEEWRETIGLKEIWAKVVGSSMEEPGTDLDEFRKELSVRCVRLFAEHKDMIFKRFDQDISVVTGKLQEASVRLNRIGGAGGAKLKLYVSQFANEFVSGMISIFLGRPRTPVESPARRMELKIIKSSETTLQDELLMALEKWDAALSRRHAWLKETLLQAIAQRNKLLFDANDPPECNAMARFARVKRTMEFLITKSPEELPGDDELSGFRVTGISESGFLQRGQTAHDNANERLRTALVPIWDFFIIMVRNMWHSVINTTMDVMSVAVARLQDFLDIEPARHACVRAMQEVVEEHISRFARNFEDFRAYYRSLEALQLQLDNISGFALDAALHPSMPLSSEVILKINVECAKLRKNGTRLVDNVDLNIAVNSEKRVALFYFVGKKRSKEDYVLLKLYEPRTTTLQVQSEANPTTDQLERMLTFDCQVAGTEKKRSLVFVLPTYREALQVHGKITQLMRSLDPALVDMHELGDAESEQSPVRLDHVGLERAIARAAEYCQTALAESGANPDVAVTAAEARRKETYKTRQKILATLSTGIAEYCLNLCDETRYKAMKRLAEAKLLQKEDSTPSWDAKFGFAQVLAERQATYEMLNARMLAKVAGKTRIDTIFRNLPDAMEDYR